MHGTWDADEGESAVSERNQLRFAAAALAAGLAWGYLRHRQTPHTRTLALLQGLEWFIAYGGAAALVGLLREALDREPPADPNPANERITRFRQVVTERTGTTG